MILPKNYAVNIISSLEADIVILNACHYVRIVSFDLWLLLLFVLLMVVINVWKILERNVLSKYKKQHWCTR